MTFSTQPCGLKTTRCQHVSQWCQLPKPLVNFPIEGPGDRKICHFHLAHLVFPLIDVHTWPLWLFSNSKLSVSNAPSRRGPIRSTMVLFALSSWRGVNDVLERERERKQKKMSCVSCHGACHWAFCQDPPHINQWVLGGRVRPKWVQLVFAGNCQILPKSDWFSRTLTNSAGFWWIQREIWRT